MDNPLKKYLSRLYARTMTEAYAHAYEQLAGATANDDLLLDCGAGSGHTFSKLHTAIGLQSHNYRGVEWDQASVDAAAAKGLEVTRADLNDLLPFPDDTFSAVVGLSVLEHLLNPCQWLQECNRVLKPGGKLVVLTPNIATYFTAWLLLLGRMPSSGPHPDSKKLVDSRKLTNLAAHIQSDGASVEGDTPLHRHLVVFSYTDLKRFLLLANFRDVHGRGFGVYPFPIFTQPLLERIDARHAHQMVFTALKPGNSRSTT